MLLLLLRQWYAFSLSRSNRVEWSLMRFFPPQTYTTNYAPPMMAPAPPMPMMTTTTYGAPAPYLPAPQRTSPASCCPPSHLSLTACIGVISCRIHYYYLRCPISLSPSFLLDRHGWMPFTELANCAAWSAHMSRHNPHMIEKQYPHPRFKCLRYEHNTL
jgi:hypothetical protein